jgi:hypothetical protein
MLNHRKTGLQVHSIYHHGTKDYPESYLSTIGSPSVIYGRHLGMTWSRKQIELQNIFLHIISIINEYVIVFYFMDN